MKRSETAEIIPLNPTGFWGRRPAHEREFLPAALEIIETPASPAGRATMATIVALIMGSILWATLGRVDIIVTAQGRIIPSGKVKEIQPFEIGVVKAIAVKDGQHVNSGEVLVELDPTTNAADVEKTARDLMHARLDEARLNGLLDPAASDGFAALRDADPAEVITALSQMQAQSREQAAKLDAIDHQLAQKRAELAGVHATIDKLEASMPMIQSRVDIREGGLRTEFGNKIDYLAAKQALSEQQHDLQVQQLKTGETGQAIEALIKQRQQTIEEFRKTAFADLSKAESQIAELSQEAIKYAQKTELQTLRAPVAGTVQQLAVHTIGGVVTPAQTLLVLVPDDAHLEIEAEIPNRDVGFVHQGQPAEVKVEAFTFTRYGLLHGQVINVSRDAQASSGAAEPQRGKQARGGDGTTDSDLEASKQPDYVALVSLEKPWIETEQGRSELTPGMSVTAEIKTGRRRVISYLLSPLSRYRQEAGRER
jgi:hemolysin D